MANILVGLVWQLVYFAVLFPCLHVTISLIRYATPRIGPDEKLFPKKWLNNEKLLNQHRIREAEKIMKMTNFQLENVLSNVEIRIVASDRGNGYLFQTAAFLLDQQKVTRYNMSVCNVEEQVFPDLQNLNLPISTIGKKHGTVKDLNFTLNKENGDYWGCLGLPSKSRYILLIEDDAVVIPQFSTLLNSLISQLDVRESIDYVKLYHPNKLRKIPSFVMAITISIAISHCLCSLLKPTPLLAFLLLSIAIFYYINTLGSQFIPEIRYQLTGSAYFSFPESCCTPAVLFRKASVSKMLRFFKNSAAFSGHAKDHILDESPFIGRQSDVNYVTHIGSFSSVRQRSVYLSDLRE